MFDSKYIESKSFEGSLYLTAGRILRDRTYSEFWCIERIRHPWKSIRPRRLKLCYVDLV